MVRTIVLNGSSVVKAFESISGTKLHAEVVPDWGAGEDVKAGRLGVAFTGLVDSVQGSSLTDNSRCWALITTSKVASG